MISFKFRTNEPNGLILMTTAAKSGNVSQTTVQIGRVQAQHKSNCYGYVSHFAL